MYLACRYTYFDNDYFSSKIQSIAHLIWLSCRRYWLLDTWLYLYQGTIITIWFDTGLSKVLLDMFITCKLFQLLIRYLYL